MPLPVASPIMLAAGFTLGCFGIHALRRHAEVLTPLLAIGTVLLGVAVGVLWADRAGLGAHHGHGRQTAMGMHDFAGLIE